MWRRKKRPVSHEGKAAREQAREKLNEAEAQWPAVREVSASLSQMNRQNHFAEAIEAIFSQAPPSPPRRGQRA